MPDEQQPRNIKRADVLMTEGFGLEVDGRMKAVFPTQEEAQKSAENLKARYPLLQVKVYDAAAHTRTPRILLPKMTSRDLVLMADNYNFVECFLRGDDLTVFDLFVCFLAIRRNLSVVVCLAESREWKP
jgi:hypothetical protein